MIKTSFGTAAVLALVIVGCQQPDDSNIAIDESNNLAAAEMEIVPPSEEAGPPAGDNGSAPGGNEADDGASDTPIGLAIPTQYRGRWGLVPADCTSTRGDAKGLISVSDKSIRYYESTGTLAEQRPAIATSFSGVFTFEGEGQEWERVLTLTRTGDSLKAAQADGTLTYKRC